MANEKVGGERPSIAAAGICTGKSCAVSSHWTCEWRGFEGTTTEAEHGGARRAGSFRS
jgi:hypothetical protein